MRRSLLAIPLVLVLAMSVPASASSNSVHATESPVIELTEAEEEARRQFINQKLLEAFTNNDTFEGVMAYIEQVPGLDVVAHVSSADSRGGGGITIQSTGSDVEQHLWVTVDRFTGQFLVQGTTYWKNHRIPWEDWDVSPPDIMAVSMYKGPDHGWFIVDNSFGCYTFDHQNRVRDNRCWLKDASGTGGVWEFNDEMKGNYHIGNSMTAWFYVKYVKKSTRDWNQAKSHLVHTYRNLKINNVTIGDWPGILQFSIGSGNTYWEKDSGVCTWYSDMGPLDSTHCVQ